MRSSPSDLRDLAHRLSYLVGPLVGATHGGGTHGGAVARDDGGCYCGYAGASAGKGGDRENENEGVLKALSSRPGRTGQGARGNG